MVRKYYQKAQIHLSIFSISIQIFVFTMFQFSSDIQGLNSRAEASLIYTGNPFSALGTVGQSPFWNWKTIETDHFRIYFPQELEKIANRSANYLEEAHRFLSPLFRWQPQVKTSILVIDNLDQANGLTAPLLNVGITLWVTPPDNWFENAYYDDWLRLLIIHEYTHLLNMDTTKNFWAPLRNVFGNLFLPNAAWPPWMLEGLAVYMETRFTRSGRGRSSYYEMLLRSAVEAGVLNSAQFMTLDKVNGTNNPYFPYNNTRYLFGYNLMNEIAHQPIKGLTADQKTPTPGEEDLLGILSDRSAGRIPFFINENLGNIIGKNWFQLWDEWIIQVRTRVQSELTQIKSQPLTHFSLLTQNSHETGNQVIGSAASPDGQWLAYSLSSADRRPGLYLRNNLTHHTERLDDKLLGSSMAFTPDSEALIYSEFNRYGQYVQYSDLKIYYLKNHSFAFLTDHLRARDPSISRDGKWVAFTLTESAVTGLALAPLVREGTKYSLGEVIKLYMPELYDHVANPQFSADGKKIYFTFHKNGEAQEDLVEIEIISQKIHSLVSNGSFNRYPAVNSEGSLFFVSDRTGADNLYRYESNGKNPTLWTNFSSGLSFPSFGPSPDRKGDILYGSIFSYMGWDLAKIDLAEKSLPADLITLVKPPAPQIGSHSVSEAENRTYVPQDYSVYPSILPRTWGPFLTLDSRSVSFGGILGGFDATDRHRYLLTGAYNSQLANFDGYALYSNRSLGPTVYLSAGWMTLNTNFLPDSATYRRQSTFSAFISYPFLWTYSSLTPTLGISTSQSFNYQTGVDYSKANLINSNSPNPALSATLTYDNTEASPLAVTNEAGGSLQIGAISYFLPDEPITKAFFVGLNNFRIAPHVILSPSFKGMWVTEVDPNFLSGNAVVQGRSSQVLGPFAGDNFNQLSIRGYPNRSFFDKAVTVAALDLTLPLVRIFRGLGTNPAFFENLYGIGFAEATFFPYHSEIILPSAGAGVRLSTEFFTVPITLAAEYHQGFSQEFGGKGDFFFQLFLNGFNF